MAMTWPSVETHHHPPIIESIEWSLLSEIYLRIVPEEDLHLATALVVTPGCYVDIDIHGVILRLSTCDAT